LVRQPKTAVFRPKLKRKYIVRRLSKCEDTQEQFKWH